MCSCNLCCEHEDFYQLDVIINNQVHYVCSDCGKRLERCFVDGHCYELEELEHLCYYSVCSYCGHIKDDID